MLIWLSLDFSYDDDFKFGHSLTQNETQEVLQTKFSKEDIDLIKLTLMALTKKDQNKLITAEICYCSVYNKCWISSTSTRNIQTSFPIPVDNCDEHRKDQFQGYSTVRDFKVEVK